MNFVFHMAWRDSRASRRRLLLLSLSIVLGIGALVAIGSVCANLRRSIDTQTNSLLGADLVINGTLPTTPEWDRALAALGGEVSRERFFPAPVTFSGGTRRIQVRAIEGGFPFYGDFNTEPADAPARLRQGGAVVIIDESLLTYYKARVGDTVKIGPTPYTIIGALKAFPGEPPAFATVQPRAFIPLAAAPPKTGAQINRINVKLPLGSDSAALVQALKKKFPDDELLFGTAAERKKNLGDSLDQIDAYFQLVGFVGLFLGAIGVASVVHVYVRQKIATIAVLRCLGASARQSFAVYLLQALALGSFGALLGALVGVAAQLVVPVMLRDLIPFKIEFFISWPSIASGMTAGLVICLLFALLPLLTVRRVPPLAALRSALVEGEGNGFDPWRVVIGVLIPVAVAGFAIWLTHQVKIGLGYAVALGVSFGALALAAKTVSWAARHGFPRRLPYVARQGILNLYRPQNRTVLLLLSLGLGTLLIVALGLARTDLLIQFQGPNGGPHPNLVLSGIEEEQMAPLTKMMADQGAPILEQTPFVRLKLLKLNGQAPGRNWTLRYGKAVNLTASYRDHLAPAEKITEGVFVPRVPAGTATVPISVAAYFTRQRASLHVGDELDWDVQGVPIHTRVASVRMTRGMRFTPIFDVLFPDGIIDGAPKYYDASARAATPAISTRVQRAVFAAYPDVKVFDITFLVQAIEGIFDKIAFVIEFMASSIVATGVIMLASAIMTGRFQRIRETVLLRTLGATHRQLVQIQLVEYAILGLLAAIVGSSLALEGNFLLAHYVFKIPAVCPPVLLLGAIGSVMTVTLVTGWLANRGVTDHPPLAVLRQET